MPNVPRLRRSGRADGRYSPTQRAVRSGDPLRGWCTPLVPAVSGPPDPALPPVAGQRLAWPTCLSLALFILLAGCAGGAQTEGSNPRTSADADSTSSTPTTEPQSEEGNRVYVLVATVVTETDADNVLAVLEENGFSGFVKEPSDGGFRVVARDLSPGDANELIVRLFGDTDVPYKGVAFEEE